MLSEINQSQEDKYCVTSLNEVPGVVKLIQTQSGMVVSRPGVGRGEEMGSYCLMGTEFQFQKVKRILEIGCTTC